MEKYSGLLALALLIIALIAYLKYYPEHEDEDENEEISSNDNNVCEKSPLDLNDEDATVACLVAAIEARQETKKNVQVISVREVK